MLLSIALIFTFGLLIGELFGKIKLPRFVGMILTGIVLGPFVLDLISIEILSISSDLRTIALVVILLRAGLNLDIDDLKMIGRPAILMSFVPAILEITAVVIFAPLLFDVSYLEAAILGSVLAAVSPAVIVPKMIYLMKQGYGGEKRVPHLVMASASVDDIFVIVLFTSFLSMYETGSFTLSTLYLVPLAIITGILSGVIIGLVLSHFFSYFRVRDTIKVLLLLAVSIFLIQVEHLIEDVLPFSALLSIMVLGIMYLSKSRDRALRLRDKFDKVWVFAELVLFVLVGAAVDIKLAFAAGILALVLLFLELLFRISGVIVSLIKTHYNKKEKTFIAMSYIPKATVQAAIGAIPLQMGVAHGDLILALAVLSIIVTAPIGALLIDFTHKKLLKKDE
jgi:NhaP-type Na+/H+ or K+/H+ antiporter